MKSITNHDVHLAGNLMYILPKNLDINISEGENLDVSVASFNM